MAPFEDLVKHDTKPLVHRILPGERVELEELMVVGSELASKAKRCVLLRIICRDPDGTIGVVHFDGDPDGRNFVRTIED